MSKRKPGTELNHENWEQEEPPEEAGEFRKASGDTLEGRKIIKPKRRLAKPATNTTSGGTSNPFNAFSGLSVAPAPAAVDLSSSSPFAKFSFPLKTTANTETSRKEPASSSAAEPETRAECGAASNENEACEFNSESRVQNNHISSPDSINETLQQNQTEDSLPTLSTGADAGMNNSNSLSTEPVPDDLVQSDAINTVDQQTTGSTDISKSEKASDTKEASAT